MDANRFTTVDEYFATLPRKAVTALQKMRSTIKKAAPKAKEVISYNMPAFKQEGILVFYAAWKEHVGLYPASPGMSVFDKELEKYERSKGTIRFPLDEPLPLDLISSIVKFRVQENIEKKLAKAKKK
jgi:uncharacterized protein YdhG (YjbR/CyaY superfamily)